MPTAKVRPAPPTTADPYAVPAVIDIAYVNRVLAALDQVDGDATREAVAARALTSSADALLKAIYEGDAYRFELKAWDVTSKRGFVGFHNPIGNRRTTARKVISGSQSCVFVQAERDYSAVADHAAAQSLPQYIVLRPRAAAPDAVNRTPWLIAEDFVRPDGSDPGNRCAG